MERQAPRQLLYENQLPLAIESKSQRRLFFPEGGSVYGPSGGTNPNIIRIPINADSLLDVQHSYLSFDLVCNITNAGQPANRLAPDIGVPFIRRLRIESGGTTLEDIEQYGKLYGGILFPVQASSGAVKDATITTGGISRVDGTLTQLAAGAGGAAAGQIANSAFAAADAANPTRDEIRTGIDALRTGIVNAYNTRAVVGGSAGNVKHAVDTTLVANANNKLRYNVPLVSALMNMEKYLPLVMMNAGLTLELELDVAESVGCAQESAAVGNAFEAPDWQIQDVRYVAHLIDLQRDFYDKMRMVMEGSGGVLQLAGSTFRHYSGTTQAAATATDIINLPARVKSIQSVFFTMTPSAQINANNRFGISNSLPNGITEYQFRIGSVVYPPTPVQVRQGNGNTYDNKGEAYQELRKAFGTLGNYLEGGTTLGNDVYLPDRNSANCRQPGETPLMSPFGLDFQSFPKTALESGVNTADRSLNMSLEIKRNTGPGAAHVVDAFLLCDAIFYINLDGSVSVSV